MIKPVSILLTMGAGFLFGVWFGFIFQTGLSGVIFFLTISLVSVGVMAGARFFQKSRPGILLFLVLFFLFSFLGAFRVETVSQASPDLLATIGEEVSLSGFVSAEPDRRDLSTRLTISLDEYPGKILAVVSSASQFSYGDEIKITAELLEPENFSTDTGREFDYRNYLAKDGIFFITYRPEIEPTGENRGYFILRALYGLKHKFISSLEKAVAEPEMSLLAGLLFGEKQGLGDDLNEVFRRVGLTHIVVLSGFNLAVVATAIFFISAAFLSRRKAILVSAIGIILFALMVGGGATVFRATIMALIALLAKAAGRTYQASIALFVAAVVMVFVSPMSLLYDVGFQLSFIATLGLIYFSPFFETGLEFLSSRFGLREVMATTLSAQVAVLPWLAFKMGEVSFASLLANALVLPAVPFVMLVGFISGLVGLFSYLVSLPFAYVSWFVLRFIIFIAEKLSAVPFATIPIKDFPIWLVILCYGVYVGLVWFYRKPDTNLRAD